MFGCHTIEYVGNDTTLEVVTCPAVQHLTSTNSAEGGNIAVSGDDFAIKESETIEAKTEEGVEAQS